MNVCLLEKFATDSLAGAAFEQHIVGNNNRSATVLLQYGEDVLEEVELFVAGTGPEIIAMEAAQGQN